MSESSGMQLVTGTRLGQYRIEEHLGMGGMGTVYKATDTTFGEEVALKMLHLEMLEDPANVARFEREARTLAGLSGAWRKNSSLERRRHRPGLEARW